MNNPSEQTPATESANPNLKWYMITARSNFENKAKAAVLASIKKLGKESLFGQIIVPEVAQTVVVKGVKKTKMHRLYPNYFLIQMVVSDEAIVLVKNSSYVTGFVGDLKKLTPLSEADLQKILGQMQNKANLVPASNLFKIGEPVRIIEGPFNNFNGIVDDIKKEKLKVVVRVSIFGRETPVDLDFHQVSKG